MDIVETSDGIRFTIDEFSALPPNQIATLREDLYCPECKGPAFYRRRSRSGQAACFGARPHAPGCSLAATDSALTGRGLGDDQDEQFNDGGRIVVDLSFGAWQRDPHNDPNEDRVHGGRGGRFVGDGARPPAAAHRRLSSLLRRLIEDPYFSQSDTMIDIPDHASVLARDFFVSFLGARNPDHVGRFLGFWGMISSAKFGYDQTLWLNSGGRGNISFCVSPQVRGEIYRRFGINEEEDFSGAYMLIIGVMGVSGYGKKYLSIDNVAYCSMVR